jgi:iron(III) transport system substrate-binding protein
MANNDSVSNASNPSPTSESSSGDELGTNLVSDMGQLSASRATTAAVLVVLICLVATLSWLARVPDDALVVYCAHDSIYSDAILQKFQDRTGIKLVIRYDTEATKSLGLVNLLIAEKDDPVCDVFWNNEVLGTMKLKTEDVLQAYSKAESSRIPSRFRDPDGMWIGFGARMRVWILNSEQPVSNQRARYGKTTQPGVNENAMNAKWSNWMSDPSVLTGLDLKRFTVAKPLYGTTLTHYSVLTKIWGLRKLQEWHHDSRKQGLKEVNGNAAVKNLVANGKADIGWTDTDDYSLAVDANSPVHHVPVLVNGKTICIPNSVAIVKGTKRLSDAEKLVEFLTSAEVEILLANSRSRQIPLGDVDESKLPAQVKAWKSLASQAIDLNELSIAHQECLDWLKSEYSR